MAYGINKTKLQLLLDAIEPSSEEMEDAVLKYFTSQDEEEYTVGGVNYFIFDKTAVEGLIKDEWDEKVEDFGRRLFPLEEDFKQIIDNLEYSEVVSSIVYDFDYDLLEDWKFETTTEGGDYYIYTEY